MINQIPTFAGLEDAVIAMIGGLSLFFFVVKKGKYHCWNGRIWKKSFHGA